MASQEYRHDWERDSRGTIDLGAVVTDEHNYARCRRCGDEEDTCCPRYDTLYDMLESLPCDESSG
jgi:hypothetical protein